MLLFSASIGPSTIHGLGCFTKEDIKKGTVVWEYDERLDRRIPKSEMDNFPPGVQEYLLIYTYEEEVDGVRVLTLCGDQAKHMNHSDDPNLREGPRGISVAARDIAAGEELTCDYSEFDLAQKL